MFKVIALIGAVAAGAAYGIHHFGPNSCDGTCPLSRTKPCCSGDPTPETSPCCESSGACPTGLASASAANHLAEKASLCCVNPCLGSVLVACEGCAACCEVANAKAAVAGPAAFAGVK